MCNIIQIVGISVLYNTGSVRMDIATDILSTHHFEDRNTIQQCDGMILILQYGLP